ncbi:dTDP-4-dehydrorhamnose reductase [Filimonas effusa]|uniref:dTDP-4-dehydrorhamnose reductase n=1 Tax=Filimonas effusa TaxID=2508721 RepID=A0A4Q1DDZ5_9BACT|nr:dTDP-4-dehydrorhamnose reductase [Filimonas effusa]RXK87125.1 dTDP-4-dehydrorhamnose reductase [Filimonas effusa]
MKHTILVSGGYGQLGFELERLAPALSAFEFIFTDRDTLDITDPGAVAKAFEQHKPAFFINCAAYTAVDKAETDRELALAINATAVGIIATSCQKHNTKLIHISTDYVFNGKGTSPYQPDDAAEPLNYYGETKYQGEQLAMKHNPDTVIIRTAWVYSEHGNNFVKTMLRLMGERQELNVVNDQVGSPTYAKDLAAAILHIVNAVHTGEKTFQPGYYHYSNTGVISWFDFATAIKEIGQKSCEVKGIPSSAYPTPAARPGYSVMDTHKIQQVYGVALVPWRPSLETCIHRLQSN